MSDQYQPDVRRESTRSFHDSLDKLQKTLLSETEASTSPTNLANSPQNKYSSQSSAPQKLTLRDFEDAVADIEQFFQSQQSKGTGSEE
jgi:hypothetical protein